MILQEGIDGTAVIFECVRLLQDARKCAILAHSHLTQDVSGSSVQVKARDGAKTSQRSRLLRRSRSLVAKYVLQQLVHVEVTGRGTYRIVQVSHRLSRLILASCA